MPSRFRPIRDQETARIQRQRLEILLRVGVQTVARGFEDLRLVWCDRSFALAFLLLEAGRRRELGLRRCILPFGGQAACVDAINANARAISRANHAVERLDHGVRHLQPLGKVNQRLAPRQRLLLAHHLYDILDTQAGVDDPAIEAIERALRETRDAHQAP